MKNFLRTITGVGIALLLLCGGSFAQVDTGTVSGEVTDTSGAVVAGAPIKLRNLQTNAARTVQSSSNGIYTITDLSTGTYAIEIKGSGFQPFTGKVEVTVGGHATVDAKL